MYLKRKIDRILEEWKASPDRKPLIIKGARQVGKTRSVRHFAEKEYKSIVEINFFEEPKYNVIVRDGYSADDIIRNITLLDPRKKIIPGETLIFFDEIQKFPDICTSFKFFRQDGRYDVIASGSLLGTSYNEIESIIVVSKIDKEMKSMDFEEFLWANGYSEKNIEEILTHMVEGCPFSDAEMTAFGHIFMDYAITGGMPEIVDMYITNGHFGGVYDAQQQIVNDYREDVRKYVTGLDQARILNVFDKIPVQLAKDNKKFQLSKVKSGARFKDYWGCIDWLDTAGVINICYCLNTPELPIKGNYDEKKYKLYYCDTGLLVSQLDEEAQEDLRVNQNLGVYKGAMYENLAGEALVKQGYDLYYYKRKDSTLEEDFFVRSRDDLIPVEIKAGNNVSRSLRELIKSEKYPDIHYGIKVISGNIGHENNIYTFPLFCLFLLKRYLKKGIR